MKMLEKKLLIADDSLTIQKIIRLSLAMDNYQIQAVADGEEALQQIICMRPDCVLIDINLPKKSAFEVRKEVQQNTHLKGIKFILMSSAFEAVDVKKLEEMQFHGQLLKPFDPVYLKDVLSSIASPVPILKPSVVLSGSQKSSSHEVPPPMMELDDLQSPSVASELKVGSVQNQNILDSYLDYKNSTIREDLMMNMHSDSSTIETPRNPLPSNDLEGWNSDVSDIKQLTASTLKLAAAYDLATQGSQCSETVSPEVSLESSWCIQKEASLKPPKDFSLPRNEEVFPDEFVKSAAVREKDTENLHSSVFSSCASDPAFLSSFQKFDPEEEGQKQMEERVSAHVQIALEKMTQKLLPEMMERIIKAEIHRLLSSL